MAIKFRGVDFLEFDTLLFGDGVSIQHDAKLRLKELVDTFSGE